ncbi:MAG: thioredoxin [Patescibacteria group bacterium]
MSHALEFNAQNFETEVLKSDLPVLVDFFAPWCGPCQMMAPVLDQLASEFDGKIKIGKINTEVPENQNLAMEYQIQSIPNMKLFKNGKVIKEFIGFRPKDLIKSELEEVIK